MPPLSFNVTMIVYCPCARPLVSSVPSWTVESVVMTPYATGTDAEAKATFPWPSLTSTRLGFAVPVQSPPGCRPRYSVLRWLFGKRIPPALTLIIYAHFAWRPARS